MKPKYIAIAAVAQDGVIGMGNQMLWRIPEDFKHFRETTMGHMLFVGHNTYISLPEKAFEGREYFVWTTRNPKMRPNVYQFSDLKHMFLLLENGHNKKVFIAGGAQVYDSLIEYCDEAIITWVDKSFPEGDKKFPIVKLFTNFVVEKDQDWQTSKNGLRYRIVYYKKKI
jgi:dihydrofolate reductase